MRLTNLDMNSLDFESLNKFFMKLLYKVAPLKTKFVTRGTEDLHAQNQISF